MSTHVNKKVKTTKKLHLPCASEQDICCYYSTDSHKIWRGYRI